MMMQHLPVMTPGPCIGAAWRSSAYAGKGVSSLVTELFSVKVSDKKTLLQLSPSQQGKALVLHTGHW